MGRHMRADFGRQLTAPGAERGGRSSVGHRVLSLTRCAWSRYWARRAANATVAVLHSLDDRALKDIGLDRSEIESVVYGEPQGRKSRDCAAANPAPLRERRIQVC
jgi:uncharacterized protein YjiS (DUF1127 family)